MPSKSIIGVSHGETDDGVLQVLSDIPAHGIDILITEHYLAPSGHHLPVCRDVLPDTFKMFEKAVGAMVRSGHHTDEQAHAAAENATAAAAQ